jgi:predicted O-linked N-acetylglucosamine transferase (SPINDLY family)
LNAPSQIDQQLGRIEALVQQGSLAAAEQITREVISLAPQDRRGWSWLGMLAIMAGQPATGEEHLRRAIALDPRDAYDWANLALAMRNQGRAGDAEQAVRQSLALDSSPAAHWAALGFTLYDQQRWAEAADAFRQSLARNASDATVWTALGAAEHALGRFDAAQESYEQSQRLAPDDVHVTTRYALLASQRGNPRRGIEIIHQVLAREPLLAPAWLVLGNSQRLLDQLSAAESAYRRAIEIEPASRDARYNLALVLLQRLSYSQAEAWARQLVTENPADAESWLVLGGALHAQARTEEAIEALQRSAALSPGVTPHSKLLVALHYSTKLDSAALLAAHRQWDAVHARPRLPANPPRPRPLPPGRKLRLGFSAIDFSIGPTGFLALRPIECFDRSQCEVVLYSDRMWEDDLTARFRAAANRWRVTAGLSDDELAEQIRRDEIDVLFDLGGHVGRRLLAFAQKPAPLQITWLGYVGTTGMQAMDCLLADRYHVRPGEEGHYAETVLRMPHDYICYGPPAHSPEIGPLPALAAGRITFGSFNNPAKYSHVVLDAWAAILQRVHGSRLLLKYGGLDQGPFCERLLVEFSRRGVSRERILFDGWSDNYDFLAAYNRIDLALDTQPYSGGLTTCESLWMGVPVITCPGMTFAGRHSTSHLTNAGLGQFVAEDWARYVEMAVAWTSRLDELAELRRTLREQLRSSLLCDGPRFAHDLLTLIQEHWNAHLQK